LTDTPWPWLKHFPRYFRAIEYRFDKLKSGAQSRDRAACEEIGQWWESYRQYVDDHPLAEQVDADLVHFRWMLEEYRVSRFAQPLGTAIPVSAKRLQRQWAKVESRE
jgi:ATP-dependent helicase HrpA